MRWSLFFSIMLFVILLISSVFEYFSLAIPFLNILPALVSSSSGFLSVLCLIAIFSTIHKNKSAKIHAVMPIIFYILDFIIINKLYLNATWPAIAKGIQELFRSIESWNWPTIILTAFCIAIAIGMLVWGISIWKKSTLSKNNLAKNGSTVSMPKNNHNAVLSAGNGGSGPTQNEEVSTDAAENTPSLAYGLVCILLIIPAVSFIQFIFYRVFSLDIAIPETLGGIIDILFYIGTICIGIVVVLLLWIAKKKVFPENYSGQFRRPAVLAFIGEILIFFLFFFRADSIDEEFLNSFLNVITNNTLVSIIVIPIVIFVILDVGISLFINIFFEGTNSKSRAWKAEAQEKIDEIQRRIVMFVLNIFLGILSLFLFIPDFFNEIGDVLLSKGDLFPNYGNGEDKSQYSSTPPKLSTSPGNSEISDEK